MADPRPIGIFDSGVGGLSVWREITRLLPQEGTLYIADQAHVPYGPRGEGEILRFSEGITRYLLEHDCKAVVVACNTASAVALDPLRERFPKIPFIGLEPAVKPAAARTRTRVVGVMATPATFQGKLFKATAGRHATGVKLINQICAGLAEQVEAGRLDTPDTVAMLRGWLTPMLEAGADTIVLACTHYPFVIDTIRRLAGPGVEIVDPAPAVAQQVQRVLAGQGLEAPAAQIVRHRFFTTAAVASLHSALQGLLGMEAIAEQASWQGPPSDLILVSA